MLHQSNTTYAQFFSSFSFVYALFLYVSAVCFPPKKPVHLGVMGDKDMQCLPLMSTILHNLVWITVFFLGLSLGTSFHYSNLTKDLPLVSHLTSVCKRRHLCFASISSQSCLNRPEFRAFSLM